MNVTDISHYITYLNECIRLQTYSREIALTTYLTEHYCHIVTIALRQIFTYNNIDVSFEEEFFK